jgi:hypothetical protein
MLSHTPALASQPHLKRRLALAEAAADSACMLRLVHQLYLARSAAGCADKGVDGGTQPRLLGR